MGEHEVSTDNTAIAKRIMRLVEKHALTSMGVFADISPDDEALLEVCLNGGVFPRQIIEAFKSHAGMDSDAERDFEEYLGELEACCAGCDTCGNHCVLGCPSGDGETCGAACPGCGCLPGDGRTDGCSHPDGCGFHAVETREIRVLRGSKDGLSGQLTEIGIRDLPVRRVPLGTRLVRYGGNGAPTPTITSKPEKVLVTSFEGRDYVVRAGPKGPLEIIVCHQPTLSCPKCGETEGFTYLEPQWTRRHVTVTQHGLKMGAPSSIDDGDDPERGVLHCLCAHEFPIPDDMDVHW